MESGGAERSKRVVGLFLAAALTLTPGCSLNPFAQEREEAFCRDENRDGICDDDGRPANQTGNRYYRNGYWWGTTRSSGWGWGSGSKSSSGVKSGGSSSGVSSGSKSGIGSSSRSSGGSSGG